MKFALKSLLAFALVLVTAAAAWAQAAGNWQRIHGQVQSVQGNEVTVKADDGRVIKVDVSQVSESVRSAIAPNMGVTVTGFPGGTVERFTARYITQDSAGSASVASTDTNAIVARITPLIPQFLGSAEFRDRHAKFKNDRQAAHMFVGQLYQGFLDRAPSLEERRQQVDRLLQTDDPSGMIAGFLRAPEYTNKPKDEQQVITDLYQGVLNRNPSPDEVRSWQQRLAQR
jgi:hypothetical protein